MNKEKVQQVLAIVLVWLMALSLVYLVFIKIKLLINF